MMVRAARAGHPRASRPRFCSRRQVRGRGRDVTVLPSGHHLHVPFLFFPRPAANETRTFPRQGTQGTFDEASSSTLENEFGTKNEDDVLKALLEKGSIQEVQVRIREKHYPSKGNND